MTSESGPSKTAMRALALVLVLAGLWVARAFLLQIAFADAENHTQAPGQNADMTSQFRADVAA